MSLGTLLDRAAARFGERPFLIQAADPTQEPLTYRQFQCRVNGLAWRLWTEGIRPGDHLAAVLPSGPGLLALWFAVARLGATLVPLNPALTEAERLPLLQAAEPRLLIAPEAASAIPTWRVAEGWGPFDPSWPERAEPPPIDPDPDRPFTLLYTSGTTGRPKGCLLTQTSYILPALAFGERLQMVPEDRVYNCLPLFHMAGQSFAAAAVAAGASLILTPQFRASRFWSEVTQTRATLFRHLGEMLAVLCKQPPHPEERSSSLRAVYGGGARSEIIRAWEERFGIPVVEGYGLTETNTVLTNDLRERRPGSIGRPFPYAPVRIASPEGESLPPGQIGEIQVGHSPVRFLGYYGDPEATEAAHQNGWYRTGDLGYADADGYIYFIGRQKELIRRRGENISPVEIESVLCRHPAVAVAAVTKVPDAYGGEEIKAFIEPAAPGGGERRVNNWPYELKQIALWATQHLAQFKVPRYWEVADQLPRTPTNKVNKGLLQQLGSVGGHRWEWVPQRGSSDDPEQSIGPQ